MAKTKAAKGRYWRAHLRCVGVLLTIWFIASFGCGILLRDWLDVNFPNVGSAPFGFWMAQQGSIITFVLVLVAYAVWMSRLEANLEHDDEEVAS
jgi:putative solute:sodium symporter small subunit